MLDLTRKITTRDGRAVRILASDIRNSNYPIIAAVTQSDGRESVISYTRDGTYGKDGTLIPLDLINPPIEVERYMVVDSASGNIGTYAGYSPADFQSPVTVRKVRITVID